MSGSLQPVRPAPAPRFVALLVVALAALTAGMLALLRVDWRPLIEGKSDLWSMIGAAAAFLHGRPIYDATNLCIGCYPSPFTYLPGNVLPFVPLVGMDGYLAFALFSVLSAALFVAGVALLLRSRAGCSWGRALALGLAGLLLFPAVDNLLWGQSQLLLTGAVALALAAPPLLGGALLGAAAYYKLYPALLIGALLLAGDRRRAWAGALAGALLGLLGLAACGLEAHLEFARFLPRLVTFFNGPSHYASNYSLRNALELRGMAPPLVSALTALMPALWAAGAWRLRRDADLCYAFTLGMIVLISPIVWRSYFLLALPIAALLYRRVAARGPGARAVYAASLVAALTAGLNLFVPPLASLPPLPLLGCAALCLLCFALARRAGVPVRLAVASDVGQVYHGDHGDHGETYDHLTPNT